MNMQVEFQLTEEDVKVGSYGYALAHGARRTWLICALIALLCIAFGVYRLVQAKDIFAVVMAVFVGVFMAIYEPANRWWEVRKKLASTPEHQRRFAYSFGEEAIEYKSIGRAESRFGWELVDSLADFREVFLLYLESEPVPWILPKRAFGGKEGLDDFRKLLERKGVACRTIS